MGGSFLPPLPLYFPSSSFTNHFLPLWRPYSPYRRLYPPLRRPYPLPLAIYFASAALLASSPPQIVWFQPPSTVPSLRFALFLKFLDVKDLSISGSSTCKRATASWSLVSPLPATINRVVIRSTYDGACLTHTDVWAALHRLCQLPLPSADISSLLWWSPAFRNSLSVLVSHSLASNKLIIISFFFFFKERKQINNLM